MAEIVKRKWLLDSENHKIAPYTTEDQIILSSGGRFSDDYQNTKNTLIELPHFYHGNTAPTNELGVDGDIYFEFKE